MPSRPAPAWVAAAFGLGVALAVLLTGPLLLFNPLFVGFEQRRHDVPVLLGTSSGEVARVTSALLGDLFLGGAFDVSLDRSAPVLDPSERSHMADVGRLVRILASIDLLAIATLLVAGWRLRAQRGRRGALLLASAGSIGLLAVVLGLFFAMAFDAAFAAFHALFFAAGTWQFGPDSNLLRLFPEPFWYEIALVAGAVILLSAAAATLVGWRDLRAEYAKPADA
jgi:integral membrane protein (TIGR01906 family)